MTDDYLPPTCLLCVPGTLPGGHSEPGVPAAAHRRDHQAAVQRRHQRAGRGDHLPGPDDVGALRRPAPAAGPRGAPGLHPPASLTSAGK